MYLHGTAAWPMMSPLSVNTLHLAALVPASSTTTFPLATALPSLRVDQVSRAFTVDEAKAAREAFITSTTNLLRAVTQIDDAVIGNGEPGETSRRLLGLYLAYARGEAAS